MNEPEQYRYEVLRNVPTGLKWVWCIWSDGENVASLPRTHLGMVAFEWKLGLSHHTYQSAIIGNGSRLDMNSVGVCTISCS